MREQILLWATFVFGTTAALAQPDFDTAMRNATTQYQRDTQAATEALSRTRARVTEEKAALLRQIHAAEERTVVAKRETLRFETAREDGAEFRRKATQELDGILTTARFANTLAHDALKLAEDSLAPGESLGDGGETLQKQLDDAAANRPGTVAMDVADFLLARTEHALGGYEVSGRATMADTNEVVNGTFAFVGPETYFLPAQGGAAGSVRAREGMKFPLSYRLPKWSSADAAGFFSGHFDRVLADASGGKAIRLSETRGTLWQHIRKGGVIAFLIIAVGVCALVFVLIKIRDLARLSIDSADVVESFLAQVAGGNTRAAGQALSTLHPSTRELFRTGLENIHEPKAILEERLQAVLLEQRLEYERHLPLLAVIATASPLMGLLGTVMGMVKTFALITVFGTGNAGKLSSGISEVLITTELGLAVAIPTLIAHGLLAQRVHKNVALLERYGLKFVTAVDASRARGEPAGKASVVA